MLIGPILGDHRKGSAIWVVNVANVVVYLQVKSRFVDLHMFLNLPISTIGWTFGARYWVFILVMSRLNYFLICRGNCLWFLGWSCSRLALRCMMWRIVVWERLRPLCWSISFLSWLILLRLLIELHLEHILNHLVEDGGAVIACWHVSQVVSHID